MPELKKEVKSYLVQMLCNECQFGEMTYTNLSFMTSPQRYQHECKVCGYQETFLKTYPAVIHE